MSISSPRHFASRRSRSTTADRRRAPTGAEPYPGRRADGSTEQKGAPMAKENGIRAEGQALLEEAGRLFEPAVELRRRIHAHPELGLHLPRTQEAVLEALDGLQLHVSTGVGTTSVVAVLDGDRAGPTTLLRGDMDALPMPEDTGLPYASV